MDFSGSSLLERFVHLSLDACAAFVRKVIVGKVFGRRGLRHSVRLAASLAFAFGFAFSAPIEAETATGVRKIAVVSFLRDEVRGQWSDGGPHKYIPVTKVDWNSNGLFADYAAQFITAKSVHLVSVKPSTQALAGLKPTTPQEFARAVAERLKMRGELQGADFVFVITPNAIDYLGRKYSAAMNFLSAGIVGVAAGEHMRAKTHYPAFTLGLRTNIDEFMLGKSQCMIGLNAVLVDVDTLYVRDQSVGIVGRAEVPSTVWKPSGSGFAGDGLGIAKQRCLQALKMGTRLAMRGVRLERLPAKATRRPSSAAPTGPIPRCRDVGGYEAYMKRTGKVCRVD